MNIAFPGAEGRELLGEVVRAVGEMNNRRLLARHIAGRRNAGWTTYTAGLRSLFAAIAEVSQAEVIVDSAKKPWHLSAVHDATDGATRFVHLVRDPRGVVHSHQKVVSYDPDEGEPELMARRGSLFTTTGWIYRNALMTVLWGREPGYQRVQYERFAADPAAVAQEILEPSGKEAPQFESTGVIDIAPGHNASGNPVRFSTGPTRIRPDDCWRYALPSSRQLLVGAATRPLRTFYSASERRC